MIKIDDHRAVALAALATEFKGKPLLAALVGALLGEVQTLEDAAWVVLNDTLDTAVGDSLDVLGRLVGLPRYSATDDAYRLRLRARILANRSDGTVDDLERMLAPIAAPGRAVVSPQPPASFAIRVLDRVLTGDEASVVVALVSDAKSSGVRSIVEWQQAANDATFTLAVGSMLSLQGNAGAQSLTLYSTAYLPQTGTATIDLGLAGAEVRAYTVTSGTTVSLAVPLAGIHAIGAAFSVVGSAGLGLGDSTNVNTGGVLCAAALAP